MTLPVHNQRNHKLFSFLWKKPFRHQFVSGEQHQLFTTNQNSDKNLTFRSKKKPNQSINTMTERYLPLVFLLLATFSNFIQTSKVFIAYPANYTNYFVVVDPSRTYYGDVTYALANESNPAFLRMVKRQNKSVVAEIPLGVQKDGNYPFAEQEFGFSGPIFYAEDLIWRQKAKFMTSAYFDNNCRDSNLVFEIFYEECFAYAPDSSNYRVLCGENEIRLYMASNYGNYGSCANMYVGNQAFTRLPVETCQKGSGNSSSMSKCLARSVVPYSYSYGGGSFSAAESSRTPLAPTPAVPPTVDQRDDLQSAFPSNSSKPI